VGKRKPHYPLSRIKALIRQGAYRITRTALRTAARDFGSIEPRETAECVLGLDTKDFCKSMTTHHDATIWQNVYRPTVRGASAYVKVQIVDDATIVISFRSPEGD